jgi:hypothetical protein
MLVRWKVKQTTEDQDEYNRCLIYLVGETSQLLRTGIVTMDLTRCYPQVQSTSHSRLAFIDNREYRINPLTTVTAVRLNMDRVKGQDTG